MVTKEMLDWMITTHVHKEPIKRTLIGGKVDCWVVGGIDAHAVVS